jgi:allantoicase
MDELLIDLAAAGLGGRVLEASDEFFAPKENLVADSPPVLDPDRRTSRGRWMDGWETRRRRSAGHEWAIVRLGLPGVLRTVVVDTSHFTGSAPGQVSVEAIDLPGDPNIVDLVRSRDRWTEVLARSDVAPNTANVFPLAQSEAVTHVRLVLYPDGGVARLRCLGEPVPPDHILRTEGADLAAIASGGRVVDCSSRGSNPNRMLRGGKPEGPSDGWLTPRRRDPGYDWAVIRLAGPGQVDRLVVDTTSFKGNAPASCDVEGIDAPGALPGTLRTASWRQLLAQSELEEDHRHEYPELGWGGRLTHLRVNIHPDGGLARFSAIGEAFEGWDTPG